MGLMGYPHFPALVEGMGCQHCVLCSQKPCFPTQVRPPLCQDKMHKLPPKPALIKHLRESPLRSSLGLPHFYPPPASSWLVPWSHCLTVPQSSQQRLTGLPVLPHPHPKDLSLRHDPELQNPWCLLQTMQELILGSGEAPDQGGLWWLLGLTSHLPLVLCAPATGGDCVPPAPTPCPLQPLLEFLLDPNP